jgi:hypothetical protein
MKENYSRRRFIATSAILQEASNLKDIPLMLEHIDKQEDYIRVAGARAGISFLE